MITLEATQNIPSQKQIDGKPVAKGYRYQVPKLEGLARLMVNTGQYKVVDNAERKKPGRPPKVKSEAVTEAPKGD